MFTVSARVVQHCQSSPERRAWLARLPQTVAALAEQWQLAIGDRFDAEGEAAWVAPVVRRDATPAVLKLGMPHFEADHEADGLRVWNGDPTVGLLASDASTGALLLERCEPGTSLRELDETGQDRVLARLLPRMWQVPPAGAPFRPLSTMLERWIAEAAEPADHGLRRAGIADCRALLETQPGHVLLATDLHAGNVLRARREPWLVIDPKPFVGDPAYDATQHLLNCPARMGADPLGTIEAFARLLELDRSRVRRWLFARLAISQGPPGEADPWRDVVTALDRADHG